MKNYIISEGRLLELLEFEARLQCLEQDGVDNWSWYMEGRERFIAETLDVKEEDVSKNDLDFLDVAKAGLWEFQEYEDSCDNCPFGSMTGM